MASNNKRLNAISADDPGVAGVVITGSAQTLAIAGRAILVGVAGSITGRLVEDTADVVYPIPVGLWPLAFKSITSVSSLTGVIIL